MIVMIHGCASPILYFYCAYVCNFTFFFLLSLIRTMNEGECCVVIRFAFIYRDFLFGC